MTRAESKAVWAVGASAGQDPGAPEWLAAALEGSGVIAASVDGELRCRSVIGVESALGGAVEAVLPGGAEVARLVREVMASERPGRGAVWSGAGSGGGRHYDVWVRPLAGGGASVVMQDVTERAAAQRARWYDLIVEPRHDAHGRVMGVGGAALEITARKGAEAGATASEGRFRALIGANVVGVMFGDAQGRVLDANGEFLRIVGYSREDLAAGRLNWQVLTPPEDSRKVQAAVERLGGTEEERRAPFELEYIRKDGTRAPVLVGVAPVGEGAELGWLVVDVSARRRAEDAMLRQATELARSNADLEHFAHVTAHDLKEPLRGIRLNAGFLMEDCRERLSGEDLRHLEALDRLCRRMHELLEAMLFYSLMGRREMELRSEDLGELAAAAVEQLQARLREAGAVVEIAGPLPRIACDRTLVIQVLANLMSNGVKYNTSMPRRVWVVAEGRKVGVRDNGIGLRPDQRERIFQMFKRLHERDAFGGGTGAGLAIVKKIVERHGGRVWVESEPGKGSTFWFTLEPGAGDEVPAGA